MLELIEVRKQYHPKAPPALDGVTFRVATGEFVAVLVVWAWEESRRLCKGLVVYREPYGQRGACRPVAVPPGESAEEAVKRVLAEEG